MSATGRRLWSMVIQFLVIGYSALGRSFAYLGLAPAKLFVGEIFLGYFMTVRHRAVQRAISLAGHNPATSMLRLAMGLFLAHGVLNILHGFLLKRPAMPTLMNFAFNYYALYMVIGLATAMGGENLMPKLARRLAWIHGLYGVAYVGGLHSIYQPIPGTGGVNMFAQPTASAFCVLALLQYEPKLSRAWFPILLNLALMAAVQVRAEWLGFAAGFALWSVLAGKVRRLLLASVALLTLVVVGLIFDVRLPGLSGRGGEISVQGIVGRVLAPLDPHTAEKYVEGAEGLGGTVDWRTRWWKSIWASVNDETEIHFFFGHGYGFELTSLVEGVEEGVRTPHSVFFYALGYGGWLGALVFIFFQVAVAVALWKAYRLTGDAFGLSYWVLNLGLGLFGNSFETPFGAIPFYLVTGIVIAPLLQTNYLPWSRPQQRPAVPMPPMARGRRVPWAVDHA